MSAAEEAAPAQADVLIVGGGIAGASLASALAPERRVIILEQEDQPGFHSTGRSAAIVSETYGSPVVRALSRATTPFLRTPPAGFAEATLLRPRPVLFVARQDQTEALDRFAAEPDVAAVTERLTGAEAEALLPILRPGYTASALLETGAAEIDVDALHQGFLRAMRRAGGQVVTGAELLRASRSSNGFNVDTTAGRFAAPLLVNAAGAWADVVAVRAGARPVGLEPRRRTAAIVEAPPGVDLEPCPMLIDVEEQFYLKPGSGRVLISPADETPTHPHDVQPEEWDVAVAVDRVEQATLLQIRRIQSRWAGLRSFVPDRNPVIGFDPQVEGFFWLAGQGGYGIQTSFGAAQLAAALIRAEHPVSDLEVAARQVAPSRFRSSAA